MGKRYLCPICEHELKGFRGYCRECRSFVKEPLVFTGRHLPNESDCYRSDVDYMDPRSMKKQQAHIYEHKQKMSDRPQYTVDQEPSSSRSALERGREWLERQSRDGLEHLRRAADDVRGTNSRSTTSRSKGYTYGGQRSSTTRQKNKNEGSGIVAIVFILFFLLSNC